MAMAQPSDGLPFPRLPPFPPSWQVRQAYLQWWLIGSLGIVGAMKSVGLFRHDLSRIAGFAEFLGAVLFLPRWPFVAKCLGKGGYGRCFRLGCWLILAGLGIIVSTSKRTSPICWSETLFTMELLRLRIGTSGISVGVVFYVLGTLCGLALQFHYSIGPFAAEVVHHMAE